MKKVAKQSKGIKEKQAIYDGELMFYLRGANGIYELVYRHTHNLVFEVVDNERNYIFRFKESDIEEVVDWLNEMTERERYDLLIKMGVQFPLRNSNISFVSAAAEQSYKEAWYNVTVKLENKLGLKFPREDGINYNLINELNREWVINNPWKIGDAKNNKSKLRKVKKELVTVKGLVIPTI